MKLLRELQAEHSISFVEGSVFTFSGACASVLATVALRSANLGVEAFLLIAVYCSAVVTFYFIIRLWLTERPLHPLGHDEPSRLERIWHNSIGDQQSGSLLVATFVILVDRFYIFAFFGNLLVTSALVVFMHTDSINQHVRWLDAMTFTTDSAGLGRGPANLPSSTLINLASIFDAGVGLLLLGFVLEAVLEATKTVLRQYGTGLFAQPAHEADSQSLTREPTEPTMRAKGGTE